MAYKRPRFVREESWRYARVSESWRSPRGKTSRVRRSKEGWPKVVKIGYSRPKAVRGAHPSGLSEVMVWRTDDLVGLDPKIQAARIAHTVGERKRVAILDQAKKENITVLNPGAKKEGEVLPEVTTEPSSAETPTEPLKETPMELTPAVTEPGASLAPGIDEAPQNAGKMERPKKRRGKGGKKKRSKK